MMEGSESAGAMDLVGGDISMDFVNTASARTGAELKERLIAYDDLVAWAERVELLGPARAARLRRAAGADPEAAAAVLEGARRLREVIYRTFASEKPARIDLEALGAAAAEAAARRTLEPTSGGFAFGWRDSDALEQILWPVALSAAELLTSEEGRRVKECAGEHCNWLFVDQSRNRSRRWCDMRECGNRAKARRYVARQRKQKG